MKFQRDIKFLIAKAISLALVTFWIFFFGNKILKQASVIEFTETELYLIMLLVFFGVNYFAKYAVAIDNNVLVVKNLYGVTIKKLNLSFPFKRKIHYNPQTYYGGFVWILLGKKYSTRIDIKFTSPERNVYINGHILSKKGLEDFIRKTKK